MTSQFRTNRFLFAVFLITAIGVTDVFAANAEKPCNIVVSATKRDGAAYGTVSLYREFVKNELGIEKRDWRHVDKWSLRDGTRTINVAPGKYKFYFTVSDTSQQSGEFSLQNTQVRPFRFFVSTVQVVGRAGQELANGTVSIYRLSSDGKWRHVDKWSTRDGTRVIALSPGSYRMTANPHISQNSCCERG